MASSKLVGSGKTLRPNEKQGTLDKVFETISLCASFSDVFPSIYKETMAVLGLSCPPLSTRDSFPGYGPRLHDYVDSARNLAFSLDIDGFNTMEYFAKKANRQSCDNFKHYDRVSETAPEAKPQEEHACSRCRSVVYCSAECQREDWRAFHRTECAEMAKEYNDRKSRDQVYTYHDRAFQTSFLRYHYESLGVNRDRGGTPYIHSRDGVCVCVCV
ncbi:hypothetical protein FA13DRAFT_1325471 [Coprinellus micaceus]|uniref:MYND-type domain-containing protein n=1 Tax=Coprinellus micaceus TaxID=71717 RepID=A0A4Y7SRI4_COPMI|nr:hypothetical protein FA13DRAFT_1325471 [Coprinellus micaceus]